MIVIDCLAGANLTTTAAASDGAGASCGLADGLHAGYRCTGSPNFRVTYSVVEPSMSPVSIVTVDSREALVP